MASLIKTNKISTPGGEEFTLPTTLPSEQSSLTSTSGGQLGYGSLGFSTDALTTDNKVNKDGEAGSNFSSQVQGETLVDKARFTNSSTANAVTLEALPTLRTGQVAANLQRTRLSFCGVNFSDNGFRPSIQLLDSSNNNIINSSSSAQALRSTTNYSGSSSRYSNNPNVSYMPMLYNESYRPTGANASSELFNQTTRRDGTAMMNGFVEVVCISSDASSTNANDYSNSFGAGGQLLIRSYCVFRYDYTSSATNNNSIIGYFNIFSHSTATLNQMKKIKFYSHTGSTVMNEGLFWTESTMNPGKTS
tara:strand:- start:2164 stop:3078 length:915 start_codon:yes stop_codon:yes gene_type:complete